MATVQIVGGKRGWHLKVNNLFISFGFQTGIKAIVSNGGGVPYGTTEWVSIKAIRKAWHLYMPLIIAATEKPHQSVSGTLVPVPTPAPQQTKWHWVMGDTEQGFTVATKRPRGKYVPEPFTSMESAQRWIAFQFLQNA